MKRLFKVFWFLAGNETHGSARMQSIRLNRLLCEKGINSVIIQKPFRYQEKLIPEDSYLDYFLKRIIRKEDIVIFHKLKCARTTRFAQQLKGKGAILIYFDCDVPINEALSQFVNFVFVPSAQMASLYSDAGYQRVIYFPDIPEVFHEPELSTLKTLRCIWFGVYDHERWESYLWLKNLIHNHFSNEVTLTSVSNIEKADYMWEVSSLELIRGYDLVLLPIRDINEKQGVKSSNKLMQAMALGLPVLVSPLPSYLELLKDYKYDIVCYDEHNWVTKIKSFHNVDYKKEVAQYNYHFIRTKYSEEEYLQTFLHSVGKLNESFFENSKRTSDQMDYRVNLFVKLLEFKFDGFQSMIRRFKWFEVMFHPILRKLALRYFSMKVKSMIK